MKTTLRFDFEEILEEDSFYITDPQNEDDRIFADGSEENTAIIAKALKLTPEAVDAIRNAFQDLKERLIETLHTDLEDLYNAIPGEKS